jgi:SAM-dependent methyltransferase
MFNLTRAWQSLNQKTIGKDAYWHIAVQNEAALRDTLPIIKSFVKGVTLDLGAGKLAWRKSLMGSAKTYYSADVTQEHPDLDTLFDVTKPFPLESESFDTVFCYSVLEHTPKPGVVLPEIHRILKPGGSAIISVPFVFYLHGEPYDYFRFTKYGVKQLAKEAGFSIESMVMNGGIFHFLLNMPSIVLSSILFSLHCIWLIFPLTHFLCVCARILDRAFDPQGRFTMNIIAVLKKKILPCPP